MEPQRVSGRTSLAARRPQSRLPALAPPGVVYSSFSRACRLNVGKKSWDFLRDLVPNEKEGGFDRCRYPSSPPRMPTPSTSLLAREPPGEDPASSEQAG